MIRVKLLLLALILGISNLMAQHTLVLSSGQKVECVVMSLNNDLLSVMVAGKEKQYQMKNVSSIFFKEYVPYDGVFIPEAKEKEIVVDGFTVRYNMKDRSLDRKPEVSVGTEDKGAVVVSIVIDRYGNVISAVPGAPGSTTSNSYLYTKAESAAKSAKFSQNLKGPLETEGTITFVY